MKQLFLNYFLLPAAIGLSLSSCLTLPSTPKPSSVLDQTKEIRERFAETFYDVNLNRTSYGYDRITDIYPDASPIEKMSLIETVKTNDTLQFQLLYACYRCVNDLPEVQGKWFEVIVYRVTNDANVAVSAKKDLFDYFREFDAFSDQQKSTDPILYPVYLQMKKREAFRHHLPSVSSKSNR